MKNIFFILIVLTILQGCTPSDVVNSPFEQKKLQVNKTTQYYWIEWPLRQKKLPKSEAEPLKAYFASKVAPNCHIRFASDSSAARNVEMTKLLKDVGFKKHQIAIDPFTPSVTDILADQEMQQYSNPDIFGLAVDTYAVIIPNCPDWSMTGGDKNFTQSYSNFGCAEAQSLAAMIVDPKDLIKPFGSGKTQGIFIQKVMEKYPNSITSMNAQSASTTQSGSGSSAGSSGSSTGASSSGAGASS